MSRTLTVSNPSRLQPLVSLCSSSVSLQQSVLVDSGSDANLIDSTLAKRLNLRLFRLQCPLEACALDGRLICLVTHRTQSFTLRFPDQHTERISFHVYQSPMHPLILGHPWLIQHNPHVDWKMGEIRAWGPRCSLTCGVGVAPPPCPEISKVTVASTSTSNNSDTETVFPALDKVPSCYHDLKQVFNKVRASALPPHRPYDCAIDLRPGTSPVFPVWP